MFILQVNNYRTSNDPLRDFFRAFDNMLSNRAYAAPPGRVNRVINTQTQNPIDTWGPYQSGPWDNALRNIHPEAYSSGPLVQVDGVDGPFTTAELRSILRLPPPR